MKIRAGDVCKCSAGKLGMVTREGRYPVTYDDGNEGEAYVGLCLTDGKPWCSRNPLRLCTIYELLDHIAEARAVRYVKEMVFTAYDDAEQAALYAFKFAARNL